MNLSKNGSKEIQRRAKRPTDQHFPPAWRISSTHQPFIALFSDTAISTKTEANRKPTNRPKNTILRNYYQNKIYGSALFAQSLPHDNNDTTHAPNHLNLRMITHRSKPELPTFWLGKSIIMEIFFQCSYDPIHRAAQPSFELHLQEPYLGIAWVKALQHDVQKRLKCTPSLHFLVHLLPLQQPELKAYHPWTVGELSLTDDSILELKTKATHTKEVLEDFAQTQHCASYCDFDTPESSLFEKANSPWIPSQKDR